MLPRPARLCRPRRSPRPAHPRKPPLLDVGRRIPARDRFAPDSPLEGDGFELSVPHERGRRFELSFFVYVPETVRVLAQRSTLLGAGGSKSRVPPGQWGELPITG